eukprot:CAMPEP_0185832196 /NCGR_PEP_ID=MMETSP1353-20130828/1945_1 /TAXON_ID=1077150 /ORGANISM="Erythrolobus australicus, Strain CCMP3124" /LENGTH=167 /DNA_ID=CAMNT_0028530347 /DNA_START=114 /DNA_END=617 /DNA_ORIENTATION=+
MSISDVSSERSKSSSLASLNLGSSPKLEPVKTQALRLRHSLRSGFSRSSSAGSSAVGAAPSVGLEDYLELAREMRASVTVRDRRYLAKVYPKCFVGFEGAAWLIKAGYAADEAEAEEIGTQLITAGILFHVCDDHEFKAKYLFYRFAQDETKQSDASLWNSRTAPAL